MQNHVDDVTTMSMPARHTRIALFNPMCRNFSEEYDCEGEDEAAIGSNVTGGCQSIFFATSPDLLTWTRLPFAPPPANDSNVFKYVQNVHESVLE